MNDGCWRNRPGGEIETKLVTNMKAERNRHRQRHRQSETAGCRLASWTSKILRCRRPASSRCMGTGETGPTRVRQSLGPAWLWSQDGFLMSFVTQYGGLSTPYNVSPSTAVAPFAESEGFPGTDAALACMLLLLFSMWDLGLCQRKTTEHPKCYSAIKRANKGQTK